MDRQQRQAGFSILAAVIVIVALAVIGTAGWLVYQHNRPKATSAASNQQQSTQQTQQTTTTPPAPTVAYLDVKEWGVKLPLPDSMKDAYYVVSNGSVDANGQPNTVWLGLKSLDSMGCAASLGNTKGADAPIGAIGRALPTDHEPVKGTLYTQLYPGVTIGGFYYFYISNTQGKTCASQTALQAIDSGFATAAKGTVSTAATTN